MGDPADRYGLPSGVARDREGALGALEYDFMAEKAASLGHAARRAAKTLEALREGIDGPRREQLLRQAADAVYAYFVQRELCGFRRHDDIVREYRIPPQVLARLGAR